MELWSHKTFPYALLNQAQCKPGTLNGEFQTVHALRLGRAIYPILTEPSHHSAEGILGWQLQNHFACLHIAIRLFLGWDFYTTLPLEAPILAVNQRLIIDASKYWIVQHLWDRNWTGNWIYNNTHFHTKRLERRCGAFTFFFWYQPLIYEDLFTEICPAN